MLNWSISRKVALLSGSSMIMVLGALIFAVFALSTIRAEMREMSLIGRPLIKVSQQIELHRLDQHLLLSNLPMRPDKRSKEQLPELIHGWRIHIDAAREITSKYTSAIDNNRFNKVRQLIKAVGAHHKDFERLGNLWLKSGQKTTRQWLLENQQRLSRTSALMLAETTRLEDFALRQAGEHEEALLLTRTLLIISAVVLGLIIGLVITGVRNQWFQRQ